MLAFRSNSGLLEKFFSKESNFSCPSCSGKIKVKFSLILIIISCSLYVLSGLVTVYFYYKNDTILIGIITFACAIVIEIFIDYFLGKIEKDN